MSKILVVEDNRDILEEIKDLLVMENFQVITAENAWTGLEKANAELPDLIISDIMMPGLDGFQFLGQLKKYPLLKKIPIIFLSAKTDSFSINKGLRLGAFAYLTKPVSPDKLIKTINSELNKKIINT